MSNATKVVPVNAAAVSDIPVAEPVVAQAQAVPNAGIPVPVGPGAAVVTHGAVSKAVELNAFSNLGAYNEFYVRQLGMYAEAATCGAWPNGYMVYGVRDGDGEAFIGLSFVFERRATAAVEYAALRIIRPSSRCTT